MPIEWLYLPGCDWTYEEKAEADRKCAEYIRAYYTNWPELEQEGSGFIID